MYGCSFYLGVFEGDHVDFMPSFNEVPHPSVSVNTLSVR